MGLGGYYVPDENSQIIYCNVTTERVRDGQELPKMVEAAEGYGKITNGLFDAGYDSVKNYGLLSEDGIMPGIRPRRSMCFKERMRIGARLKEKDGNARLKDRYIRLKVLEGFLTDEDGWKQRYGFGRRWVVEGRYSVKRCL